MGSGLRTSVLELAVGGTPFPHGDADGRWRYRHAVRPEGATALDHQAVADFVAYEAAHGRTVSVEADPSLSDRESWQAPEPRVAPDSFPIQCCSHVYAHGCGSPLVCHGTPAAGARKILEAGELHSSSVSTGRDASELAAASTWGEPPDYFDHVMFANGRCTAPEAVAYSRSLGRDLVPSDLDAGYPPSVRFYFDWRTLAVRPDARFDGVHPVKIERSLPLNEALVAVVVHADQRHALPTDERCVVLDLDAPTPHEWATASDAAAERLR